MIIKRLWLCLFLRCLFVGSRWRTADTLLLSICMCVRRCGVSLLSVWCSVYARCVYAMYSSILYTPPVKNVVFYAWRIELDVFRGCLSLQKNAWSLDRLVALIRSIIFCFQFPTPTAAVSTNSLQIDPSKGWLIFDNFWAIPLPIWSWCLSNFV